MVFPSVPVYLDPPNWNQQQAHHHHHHHHQQQQEGGGGGGVGIGRSGGEGSQQLPPVGLAGSGPAEGGGMACAIRPGSMADRARLAKIPQPEPGLKCPRCDSTNTKFCYFNNYSLSQPRHFCKTCRRYWTRGGALRNVPVGGGCRRNKRSKSNSGGGGGSSASKSSTTTNQTGCGGGGGGGGGASSSSSTATSSGVGGAITSTTHNLPLPSQLPFMASLHPLPDFSVTNFGMNFSGIQPVDTLDYQLGTGGGNSGGVGIGLENLRLQQMQQFPLLGGLDLPQPPPPSVTGLYSFISGEGGGGFIGGSLDGQLPAKGTAGPGLITEMASVKVEDGNQQLLNLRRQYLGSISRSDQFWSSNTGNGGGGGGGSSTGGSGGWATDVSGFNSSSGNIL